MPKDRIAPPGALTWSIEWTTRAVNNAIASATVYEISPNSYTFEALQDVLAVRDMVRELERRLMESTP